MAEESNKLERLVFVGLYDSETEVAEVTMQDPAGLPGVAVQTFKVGVQTVAHYCAEAWTLLIARRVKLGGWSPALDWLPTDPQVSTIAGLTITGAVNRLPEIHADWIRDVNKLLMGHEAQFAKVTYLDGRPDPKPSPGPSSRDDTTLTISVDGKKAVPLTDKQFRDLPGKIRKLAKGRQAGMAVGGR